MRLGFKRDSKLRVRRQAMEGKPGEVRLAPDGPRLFYPKQNLHP